jgi:hypothetical protein
MDTRTKGAWIVHHTNKLNQIAHPLEYENVLTAGKAGILLSGLSADEQLVLPHEKVEAIRKASGIMRTELPELLRNLSSLGVINVSKGNVEVLGVSAYKVLEHTAQLFDTMNPSNKEHASLAFADLVSEVPVEHSTAVEHFSDEFLLPVAEAKDFVQQCEEIGFVDAESLDRSRRLYFNGNIFRRDNTRKIEAVFASLNPNEISCFKNVDELLIQQGAVTLQRAKAELGEQLFAKLHAAGVFDLSEVANDTESVFYVTRPAAFGKFGNPFTDDALDLAKAFVTCLTYGMTRRSAGTGRITMVKLLLGKLLSGQQVGPATAIGQDYRVLEWRRVVGLEHFHGSQYYMRLLKREIGELAYEVISLGEAAESALVLHGAAVSRYTRPEETRSSMRKTQNRESRRATADILTALRTGAR